MLPGSPVANLQLGRVILSVQTAADKQIRFHPSGQTVFHGNTVKHFLDPQILKTGFCPQRDTFRHN
jgi:hypothetical protein